MSDSSFWHQLSQNSVRAHAAQLAVLLTDLNHYLATQLQQRGWAEDVAFLCALLQENSVARWSLGLGLVCCILALLLRITQSTCKMLK